MLKSVAAISEKLKELRLSEDEIKAKQGKLLDALSNPFFSHGSEKVVDVFSHGSDVARVVRVDDVKDNEFFHGYIGVQVWSAYHDDWQTQKSFRTSDIELRNRGFELAALDYARNKSPLPTEAELRAKWDKIHAKGDHVWKQVFDSKESVLEFWYETKAVDWRVGIDSGHPWMFDWITADTLFRNDGVPNPEFGEKLCEKIDTAIMNLKDNWEFGSKDDLIQRLKNGEMGDDIPIIMEHFGCDYKRSCDLVFEKKHLEALQLLNEAFNGIYVIDLSDMVDAPDVSDAFDDAFIVSVSYEKWTAEDRDAGECSERGLEVEREVFDTDDLMACARRYGFSQASASSPAMNPHIWFSTIEPTNDREYFENGVEKFYSLHVHSINGRELEAEDFQRIANIIGVKFDNPLVLESKRELDSETTTLTIG